MPPPAADADEGGGKEEEMQAALKKAIGQPQQAASWRRLLSSKVLKPFAVKVTNIPFGFAQGHISGVFGSYEPEHVEILPGGTNALVYLPTLDACQKAVKELHEKAEIDGKPLRVILQTVDEVRPMKWQQRKREEYLHKEEIASGFGVSEYDRSGELEAVDSALAAGRGDLAELGDGAFEAWLAARGGGGAAAALEDPAEAAAAFSEWLAAREHAAAARGPAFAAAALPPWEDVRAWALARRRADRAAAALRTLGGRLAAAGPAAEARDPPAARRHEAAAAEVGALLAAAEGAAAAARGLAGAFPAAARRASEPHERWFDRLDPVGTLELEAACTPEEAAALLAAWEASPKYRPRPADEEAWEEQDGGGGWAAGAAAGAAGEGEAADRESIAYTMKEQKVEIPGTEGPWAVTIVKEDSTTKVVKGGYLSTNRAVVVIGNLKGAVGYGMGKAAENRDAVDRAIRAASRNLIYVDRFLDGGLAQDCAGKHNNCLVKLRAVRPGAGLSAGPLIRTVLQSAGVADASGKAVGRRNAFAVLRATFRALERHEGVEAIARKRGKRILSMEQARAYGL